MTLSDLEQQYGFRYPAHYRQMEPDGMLDVGEFGPTWRATILPRLLERPTLFFHSADFELLSVPAAKDAIDELADPEGYRQIRPGLRFIPFGQTGAGDHYCFDISATDGDAAPIILLWHDLSEAERLAKNFDDYLFKVLLTDLSEQDTYNAVSDIAFREATARVQATHLRYLPAAQAAVLQAILTNEIKDYEVPLPNGRTSSHRGLLTATERDALIAHHIPYEQMGERFEYSDC